MLKCGLLPQPKRLMANIFHHAKVTVCHTHPFCARRGLRASANGRTGAVFRTPAGDVGGDGPAALGSRRRAEQSRLSGGSADGSDRHHPRTLCGLRPDACRRESARNRRPLLLTPNNRRPRSPTRVSRVRHPLSTSSRACECPIARRSSSTLASSLPIR